MRLADSFRVGRWSVHPRLNHIDDGHETRHLGPKVMDVLCHLARHVDEVLTREDLLEAVWPGITVGDDALTRAVAELRRALGDDARSPAYVETIPKRGYRLRAGVTFPEPEAATPDHRAGAAGDGPADEHPRREASPRRSMALLVLVALVGAGVAVFGGLSAVRRAAQGAAVLPRTRPLTSYPGAEREPSLSPGGDRVAFTWVGGSGTVRNLYVKMVDGGNPVLVSSGASDASTPAWSPDGRRIAFLRDGKGTATKPRTACSRYRRWEGTNAG
jgi:DNA-binding winged helix-turn-helix (wHTH) protein